MKALTLIQPWATLIAIKKIEGNELAFGDYTAGRYGWKLHDVKCLQSLLQQKVH